MKPTKSFREIIQLPESPLSFHGGTWSVKDRRLLWKQFGSRIFDDTLDTIQQIAVEVLSENDPKFQLDKNERYTASIRGKVCGHSPQLRRGLAETLAMLACHPEALTNCTTGKPEATSAHTVRAVLHGAEWVRWASLDRLLPTLAEAAPSAFLETVEAALQSTPCPFDELFAQEGGNFGGSNYMSGLLWALEGLAWSQEHFFRVMLALAGLADRDPGGRWANRPSGSMAMILLPWLPQTTVALQKKLAAVEAIHKEHHQVAWKLLLSLMPGRSTVSTPTHVPEWRSYRPGDWKNNITRDEYRDQVEAYAKLLLKYGLATPTLIPELIERLDNLPRSAIDQILETISSDEFMEYPEAIRSKTWETMSSIVRKHQRFKDADWALPEQVLKQANTAANKIKPLNPFNQYRYLFVPHDHDLYERKGDWEKQREQLELQRQQAIKTIDDSLGLDEVMKFAQSVKAPRRVGFSLGQVGKAEYDKKILPNILATSDESLHEFTAGYVIGRWLGNKWNWVDSLDRSKWTSEQAAYFLRLLPFVPETWERVDADLGEHDALYWANVGVMPYDRDCDTNLAANKLLKHGRPKAALRCLTARLEDSLAFDPDLAIDALLRALRSDEPAYSTDTYELVELIRSLQEREDVNHAEMLRVEWSYLPILDEFSAGSPVLLETQMASDPEAFCHVIKLVYRSTKDDESKKSNPQHVRAAAENAFRLLHNWRTPPGTNSEGIFSGTSFASWVDKVVELTSESGHLEVALQQVGQVLIYTPPSEDGLALRSEVAKTLNRADMEEMRTGYRLGIYNSRGTHYVDPSGGPELELAKKYEEQANDIENAGFARIATTLRTVADQYRHEAKMLQEREPRL